MAVNKGHNPWQLFNISMLDGLLMLWVSLPVVDTIHLQSTCNKFITGRCEDQGTCESKLNHSPEFLIAVKIAISFFNQSISEWTVKFS